MMRSILNRGLVKKIMEGKYHVGYSLTRRGRDLIKEDLLQSTNDQPTLPPVVNRAKLIRDIGTVAKDIFHVSDRLKEIDAIRLECHQKIEALNKEEQEICELLENAEIEKFLSQIVDVKLKRK